MREVATGVKFQSTHPHGVRQAAASPALCEHRVSIHAPTRGATTIRQPMLLQTFCFNPRTHTGCDASCCPSKAKVFGFNPRTHTGCDLRAAQAKQKFLVSIHAPTRGATSQNSMLHDFVLFQSTHPHGVRPKIASKTLRATKFQSTHPHGVRPRLKAEMGLSDSFNPRTHTGCDALSKTTTKQMS